METRHHETTCRELGSKRSKVMSRTLPSIIERALNCTVGCSKWLVDYGQQARNHATTGSADYRYTGNGRGPNRWWRCGTWDRGDLIPREVNNSGMWCTWNATLLHHSSRLPHINNHPPHKQTLRRQLYTSFHSLTSHNQPPFGLRDTLPPPIIKPRKLHHPYTT